MKCTQASPKENLTIILKSIIFLVLFVISVFFMKEVWYQFRSKDTGMKQIEKPIFDFPTITICTSHNTENYRYGEDFNISYSDIILTFPPEDEHDLRSISSNDSSIIEYQRVRTKVEEDLCFRLIKSVSRRINYEFHSIKLHFHPSKSIEELPKVKLFFTSKINSEGIIFQEFWDGYELKKLFDKVVKIFQFLHFTCVKFWSYLGIMD